MKNFLSLAVLAFALSACTDLLQFAYPTISIGHNSENGRIQVYSLPGSGSGFIASFESSGGAQLPGAINVPACPVKLADGSINDKNCGPFTGQKIGPATIVAYIVLGDNGKSARIALSAPVVVP